MITCFSDVFYVKFPSHSWPSNSFTIQILHKNTKCKKGKK
jgi:hypothetical protein